MAISQIAATVSAPAQGTARPASLYLQGLESVQIHDLRQEEDWQATFEQDLVGRPVQELSQQNLLSRQEKLERLIG